MPRGKTQRSVDLIAACYDILQEIHPATVRAVCYQLFIRGQRIPSMERSFHPDPKHWKSVKELYSLRNTFRLQFFPSGHPHTRQGKGLGERDVSAVQ